MITGISSATTPISSVSIAFSKQIQALEAQVANYDSRISELQERIMAQHQNTRQSSEQRTSNINSINEQIGRIRERIAEVRTQISEVRSRQRQAESEARRRQEVAQERAEQTRPQRENDEAAVVDGSLVHAIIGASNALDEMGGARVQLSSRQRTASGEDIWRVVDNPGGHNHGRMEIIPIEQRVARNPEEAANAQSRLESVEGNIIRSQASRAAVLANAGESANPAKSVLQRNEESQDENDEDRNGTRSGTGRMGVGQFLEERA